MENENYMPTNRLEAFYDAIIAIIVTVLVLELPQPETASIAAIKFLFCISDKFFSMYKSVAVSSCNL